MPAATLAPCPSEPQVTSMPGVSSLSTWLGTCVPISSMVSSRALSKKPFSARAASTAGAAWPLLITK